MGLGALLDREVRHDLGIGVSCDVGRGGGGEAMIRSLTHLHEFPWIHEVAIEATRNAVVVCDEDGTIVYANPRVAAIFGYESSELLGASIDCLLLDESRGKLAEQRARIARDSVARDGGVAWELSGRRKNGTEIPIEVALTLTRRGDRRMVVASLLDISDRRRLEQSQAQLERALAEVKRL